MLKDIPIPYDVLVNQKLTSTHDKGQLFSKLVHLQFNLKSAMFIISLLLNVKLLTVIYFVLFDTIVVFEVSSNPSEYVIS